MSETKVDNLIRFRAEYDLENGLDGPEPPFYLSLAQATGGPYSTSPAAPAS